MTGFKTLWPATKVIARIETMHVASNAGRLPR
jgi:hypothetical protein